jgi:pilus assembly protein Flp/PilA
MKRFRAGVKQDTGASAVEYGLILFAIAALVVVVMVSFGGAVRGLFQDSCDTIKDGTKSSATCGP